MRFWLAGLAALGGMMTVSASAAGSSSIIFVAPPKVAVSSSFTIVAQIPPPEPRKPPKLARSPLDQAPAYRWDARPTVVSASIVAYGTREDETPAKGPIPRQAPRLRIARAAPATVIRTGVPGGAFPGSATVAVSQAPSAPGNAPRRDKPARAQPPPEPLSSPLAAPQ